MKKKLKKIHVGRELFLSWSGTSLVIGRPHAKRHLTLQWDRRRLCAHLTDEAFPPGHRARTRHLGGVSWDVLERLSLAWRDAGVDAFVDGLVPIDPEGLAEFGFKIATAKTAGLQFARTFLKPRFRPVLSIRQPSNQECLELERHCLSRLVEPSHLDSLRDCSPGTVSAVLVEEGKFVGSFQLFYYPHGPGRTDGTVLEPGWYALLHPELMHTATTKVLLEFVDATFFSKIERALRFLGFAPSISPVEMEDAFRRVADGEPIEQIRAERESKGVRSRRG